jgi:tetratricopeptide (TPR) repeat protein
MSSAVGTLLLLATLFTLGAMAGGDPLEPCSQALESIGGEERCRHAIAEAQGAGNSELASQLLEVLATNYEKAKRYEEAIALLRRAVHLASERPHNAARSLARLLEQSGNLEEARDVLGALDARYESHHPGDAWTKGHIELELGDLSVKLGQRGEAEEYYTRSIDHLSRGPGPDPAYPAVARLIRFYLEDSRVSDAVRICMSWKLSRGIPAAEAKGECAELAK